MNTQAQDSLIELILNRQSRQSLCRDYLHSSGSVHQLLALFNLQDREADATAKVQKSFIIAAPNGSGYIEAPKGAVLGSDLNSATVAFMNSGALPTLPNLSSAQVGEIQMNLLADLCIGRFKYLPIGRGTPLQIAGRIGLDSKDLKKRLQQFDLKEVLGVVEKTDSWDGEYVVSAPGSHVYRFIRQERGLELETITYNSDDEVITAFLGGQFSPIAFG